LGERTKKDGKAMMNLCYVTGTTWAVIKGHFHENLGAAKATRA
jgi:hypothetical protein